MGWKRQQRQGEEPLRGGPRLVLHFKGYDSFLSPSLYRLVSSLCIESLPFAESVWILYSTFSYAVLYWTIRSRIPLVLCPADHELSDLQDLLDEAIQVDFNVQAEDDSPYMVARSLFNTYHQVANGDYSYVETLRQQFEQNGTNQIVAESMRNSAQFLGGEEESSSDDEGDDDENGEGGAGDGMDIDDEEQGPPQPVVDEDGFELVQRRGRR